MFSTKIELTSRFLQLLHLFDFNESPFSVETRHFAARLSVVISVIFYTLDCRQYRPSYKGQTLEKLEIIEFCLI